MVIFLEKIGKTKLTMNKEMLVVVYADVYMKDANDADELYFVMFNILQAPVKFSFALVILFPLIVKLAPVLEKLSLELERWSPGVGKWSRVLQNGPWTWKNR